MVRMKELLRPTGAMLVGTAFLLLYVQANYAAPDYNSSLEKINEFHDQFKTPASIIDKRWSDKELPPKSDLASFANRDDSSGLNAQLQGVIAINSEKRRSFEYDGLLNSTSSKANFMNIEVSRITVIAINMVEGGSAIATSDIILNPVQYLSSSSPQTEAEEKLK
jgi:hypothetical protein